MTELYRSMVGLNRSITELNRSMVILNGIINGTIDR